MYNNNNYLIKNQNGIYKNKNAIYKSDTAEVSDFVVSQPHVYQPSIESDTETQNTKINFLSSAKIPSLVIRIKNA